MIQILSNLRISKATTTIKVKFFGISWMIYGRNSTTNIILLRNIAEMLATDAFDAKCWQVDWRPIVLLTHSEQLVQISEIHAGSFKTTLPVSFITVVLFFSWCYSKVFYFKVIRRVIVQMWWIFLVENREITNLCKKNCNIC